MSSYIKFPSRYFDQEIAEKIKGYYHLNLDINRLEHSLPSDVERHLFTEECLEAMENLNDDIYTYDGIISLTEGDHYNDERMTAFEDFFRNKRVPYDSYQGDKLYKYLYRPEKSDTHFEYVNHPDVDTGILFAHDIIRVIDSIPNNSKMREVLLKNIEDMIYPVPKLESYTNPSNNSFIATGLRDIRLLA